jgi:hypothetical protein
MSTQLKFRRGNTATAAAFVGDEAEFFVNSDTNRVSIHDGSSPGGHVLASNTDLISVNNKMQAAYNKANVGGTFTGTVTIQGDTTASGNLSVGKNLTVTGNLSVLGNTVSIGTSTLEVADPMILLAQGNYSTDALDIGFAGSYNDVANAHTGMFRDAVGNKEWYLFEGYTQEVSGNNNIIVTDPSFNTSNLNVRRVTGNVISQFVTIGGRDVASVQSTQNTNITSVNQFTQGAYDKANAAFNASNTAVSIEAGIDASQNAAIAIIQGVDLGQNTTITAVNNFAAAAFATANGANGEADAAYGHANNAYNYANTAIAYSLGIDATQNAAITIIQGVDNTQNTQIGGIQGVDLAQNTSISIIQGVDLAQNAAITIIQGVDTTQNTNITAVQGKMESAFAAANTKVATVAGTSGRVTSSGTTAITIDLATSGVSAASYGSASAIPAFTVDTYGRITQANSTSFSAVTSAVAGTGVSVSAATGAVTFSIGQAVATGSSVQFGSFGVGTAASGTTGEIRATNNITAFYSDKRLKDIISTIPNALAKLLTLSGVIFTQNKKAEEFGYNNYEEQVGVIAQEVQAVLPQVVKPAPFDLDENNQSKSGDNYITVQYEKLVPLLIEAIKEQQKQIDELKAKVGN